MKLEILDVRFTFFNGCIFFTAYPAGEYPLYREGRSSLYKSTERVVCVHCGLRKVSKWTTQRQGGEVSLELKQIGLYPACTLLPYGS